MTKPDILTQANDAQIEALINKYIANDLRPYLEKPIKVLLDRFNRAGHGVKLKRIYIGIVNWDAEIEE